VEKPGRYCGGEHGRLAAKDASLQTLIAFPDLYEIGMSNQALRIIYNGLNRIPGVSCDRAFAPAPDFEQLLRDRGLPLYGLDTGVSLKSLDLLLFTLGYELGLSGILAMLDVSGIPLHKNLRGESDPLLIAGGPAVSNPLPYSDFIDAFWIGEAEAGFFDLVHELLEIKQNGGDKAAMLEHVQKNPHIWVKGKKAVRAIDVSFGKYMSHNDDAPAVYPIPSMKIVQHHGILEIMRGCPNGCRFCHAGYWYRPMRQKNRETLVREAGAFIALGGYREMSLSSLSSGDYAGIGELVDDFNSRFSGRHVSFQLPSLRVSTFSLSLLEKIATTRRSGLTFAVETPRDFWQMALNKQVTADSVVEILKEAKRNGWRGAKFYFMIGLPLPDTHGGEGGVLSEEEEIVNFVNTVARRTAMHFNVNVGIFVPKPHTPYQWARQIDGQTAAAKLDFIRSQLKSKGHKVSVSDTLVSMLEGILSRGDERAGGLFEQAFHAGNRLDPWKEFIARDVWQDMLTRNAELAEQFLAAADPDAPLPWQDIVSGIAPAHLRAEFAKSERGELTPPCTEDCVNRCGVCSDTVRINTPQTTTPCPPCTPCLREIHSERPPDPTIWRLLFSFTKEGSAVFHGHLSLIEIFSMAMGRAGLDVLYTQGFNPLVKLEIVSPLSIGISAGAEIAAADFSHEASPGEFTAKMNAALPEGIRVNRAEIFCIPAGSKKHSLSSLLWGFGYAAPDGETVYVPAAGEKAYRAERLSVGGTAFSLRRACVLAKNAPSDGDGQPWASYFNVYGCLYSCKKIPHML
jgi:radical SAM family uncharacterized protein